MIRLQRRNFLSMTALAAAVLIPLNRLFDERYAVYFKVIET